MVRRGVPLLVNVLVAALAGLRFFEELSGNALAVDRLRGAGKEFSLRPIALAVHGQGSSGGIRDAVGVVPAVLAVVVGGESYACGQQRAGGHAGDGGKK